MSRSSDESRRNNANKGVSLFPEGLLMYDLPSFRRTASRTSSHVEVITQPASPSPVPSVFSQITSIENFSSNIYLVVFFILFNPR